MRFWKSGDRLIFAEDEVAAIKVADAMVKPALAMANPYQLGRVMATHALTDKGWQWIEGIFRRDGNQDVLVRRLTPEEAEETIRQERQQDFENHREGFLQKPILLSKERFQIAEKVIRERHPEWSDRKVREGALGIYSVTGGSGPFGPWACDAERQRVEPLLPSKHPTTCAVREAIGAVDLARKVEALHADPGEFAMSVAVSSIRSWQGDTTHVDYSECSCCEWVAVLRNHPEHWDLFLARAPKPKPITLRDGTEAYSCMHGVNPPEGFTHCLVMGLCASIYVRPTATHKALNSALGLALVP